MTWFLAFALCCNATLAGYASVGFLSRNSYGVLFYGLETSGFSHGPGFCCSNYQPLSGVVVSLGYHMLLLD